MDPAPDAQSRNVAVAVSVAAGFCVWAGFSLIGGGREAWDTGAWWWLGLPLLAVASGLAGYLAPVRVWRWPLFIAGGQLLAMIAIAAISQSGAEFGLLPLALVFVMLPLVIILTVPALIGGVVARGGWDRGLLV